ncbi:MAG TPA: DUF2267 domain-containing protein [Ferrovibrio sp.]|jgi:uncharacterized protein (DUF2267 family)|uniref:DUF2267 domain-containing protein n=1 Tax=Ferrovibrio sp. TaxID=1917215 RepID=UPI002ED35E18
MSATGLDVFDKTLHTTNSWLDRLMAMLGPDRQTAWHVLGVVLRSLRDRLPLDEAVHLGAQLPLLVRGLYYDQWHKPAEPERIRSQEEFLARVGAGLQGGTRPINTADAVQAVFTVLDEHVTAGQIEKVKGALPKDIAALWPQAPAQRKRA